MSITRSDIVTKAKSFLGVKWVHQGRARSGVDCVGLIYAVGVELGLVKDGLYIPPYRTQPDGTLLSYFDKHLDRIAPRDAGKGSVVIFGFGTSPHHAGILLDEKSGSIAHAYAGKRCVVIDHLESKSKGRRVLRAFDFRGVSDG